MFLYVSKYIIHTRAKESEIKKSVKKSLPASISTHGVSKMRPPESSTALPTGAFKEDLVLPLLSNRGGHSK